MTIFEKSPGSFDLNDLEYSPGRQVNLCAFEIEKENSDNKILIGCKLKNIAPIEQNSVKIAMHDNFKYHATFDGIIVQAKVAAEEDKYLATASINQLRQFLPNHVNLDINKDLMAVAFDAFVVNRGNKNGHIIGNDVALAMVENFVNKPFNIEHNRKTVVGFCTGYAFSEFGTSNPLTLEQVQNTDQPFNVVLSGYVWKIVNPDFASELVESSDPSSPKYLSVSASWELGFNEFNIASGSKNLNEATIIDEEKTILDMKDSLKVFGGNGYANDGQPIYLNLQGSVLPLGIGFTNNPAAEVKGIVISYDEPNNNNSNQEEEMNKKSVSSNEQDVKNNMQINKLEDITDAAIQELSASAVREFISNKIAEHAKDWSAKLHEKETALETAAAETNALKTDLETIKAESEKVKAEISAMQHAIQAQEIEATFQRRMSLVDDEFNLTDADRTIVAEDLHGLTDDASFEKWYNKFATIAAAKKKVAKEVDADDMEDMARSKVKPAKIANENEAGKIVNDNDVSAKGQKIVDTKNTSPTKIKNTKDCTAVTTREEDKKLDNGPVTASVDEDETVEEKPEEKVEEIVASAKIEQQLIPNSMSPSESSLIEKISAAFNRNSVTFKR